MDSKHYPDGIPLDEEMQEGESAYPDIEEPAHHTWQNDQSFDVGNMLASVLDPRLFGEQIPQTHPQSINQYSHPPHGGQGEGEDDNDDEAEAEANDIYPEEYDNQAYPSVSYPPLPDEEAASDEDFLLSGDESERYVG